MMLKKIVAYVKKWQMLEKDDRVIVGVSGGADSICLLFVLLELQKEYGFEIIAVHVNHELRGMAAKEDEAYVKRICEERNIPCVVYSENVELVAKKRKQSIEEAGRDIRRELFEKTRKEYAGTKIALAHHKNDNVETLFMNLARGSKMAGLGGMCPVNDSFIRPLLCVSRKEIEEYLDQNHIHYCTDETNFSDHYTRNRVRNHMIPYMEEHINAKAVEHISDSMEMLRETQQFLQEEVAKYATSAVRENGTEYCLLASEFATLPNLIKTHLVKEVLQKVSGKAKDLESTHVAAVLDLFEKQVGRKIDLPYQMVAKRVYEGVNIGRKPICNIEIKEAFLQEPKVGESAETNWNGMCISYRVWERQDWERNDLEKSGTKAFDYDIISDVLCVRTRKVGDYITLNKDGGTQKLKSYFINEKVEQSLRDNIPVVADGSHVLWIVGYRTNPAYHVTENTKRVLEIKIEGERHE